MQRALIEGVEETGVSVAYTVLRCDAGPVLAQEKVCAHACCTQPHTGQQRHTTLTCWLGLSSGSTGLTLTDAGRMCGVCPFVVLSLLQVSVDPDIQAPDLLALLFKRGAALLLDHLPHVWAGTACPTPQEEGAATHAAKARSDAHSTDTSTSSGDLPNLVVCNIAMSFTHSWRRRMQYSTLAAGRQLSCIMQ